MVGNKIDLDEQRIVALEEAQELANQKQIIYCEVSAKTGENVNSLFYNYMFDQIISQQKGKMIAEDDLSKNY